MKNILGKKYLFIIAHPDDESFTSAGTIYRNVKEGGEVHVVCATLGEQGSSHLKRTMTKKALKTVRKKELQTVSKLLGVKRLQTLTIPDTKVAEHKEKFYNSALQHATRYVPDYIFSFDEFGLTGHQDHIVTSAVARRVAKKLHIPLVTFTLPSKYHKGVLATLMSKRKKGIYKKNLRFKKGNISVAIDPNIKAKAFACHTSQLDDPKAPFAGFPKGFVEAIYKREYFVLNS